MQNESKLLRMRELVEKLNEAGKAYYQDANEIMSNREYDRLYDELTDLEKDTGITLGNSPTIHVGYEVLSELPKIRHEQPMLSLDKTKDVHALTDWLGDQKALLSWKLDGLTIVLTYRNRELIRAVTRGNGEIGEEITNNAKVFQNVPHRIAFEGELVIVEAIIKYSDFKRINDNIEDVDAKYKNPRNLCSGSVRQLNNEITRDRNVFFFAFTLVQAENIDFGNSRKNQMEWLAAQGFDTVEYTIVDSNNVEDVVKDFEQRIENNDIPSDGLVLVFDDIAYSASLGRTAKFPRDSIAFKWADETRETKLTHIEWSASRTGLINPIAVFEPVELEGSTVSRASVHNLSIVESLELGIGDRIGVYKANMIIPQIAENYTRSGNLEIPKTCPVCQGPTKIVQINDVKSLYCVNPECEAKKIKLYTHFVSRDAFNIEGLSEATLEKFVTEGFIKEPADLFKLERYKETIINMEGFGQKSFDNMIESVNRSRLITLPRLIYSLGIPNVGLSNAKLLCKAFNNDLKRLLEATDEQFTAINGIGQVIAESFINYFKNTSNREMVNHLLEEVELQVESEDTSPQVFEGKTFVITGSLNHFSNRNALKALIESGGGKVAGSVSSKTSFLINNDNLSGSSKNKKAKELNIPIITEDEFMHMFL